MYLNHRGSDPLGVFAPHPNKWPKRVKKGPKGPQMAQNDQKWPQKWVSTARGPSGHTNFDSPPHFTPTLGVRSHLEPLPPPKWPKGSKRAQKGPKWLKMTKNGPKRGSRRYSWGKMGRGVKIGGSRGPQCRLDPLFGAIFGHFVPFWAILGPF